MIYPNQDNLTEDDQATARSGTVDSWPARPRVFPLLMTPTEAAQYLRLDETDHTPKSARRTLDYWRSHGELRATKYARHVWFVRDKLDAFMQKKTETHDN